MGCWFLLTCFVISIRLHQNEWIITASDRYSCPFYQKDSSMIYLWPALKTVLMWEYHMLFILSNRTWSTSSGPSSHDFFGGLSFRRPLNLPLLRFLLLSLTSDFCRGKRLKTRWIYRQAGSHEFKSASCYLLPAARQSEIWPSDENALMPKSDFFFFFLLPSGNF